MSFNQHKCPHVDSIHFSHVDLKLLEKVTSCRECDYSGLNLWICLYDNCQFVGCSEQANDHSTEHFQLHQHAIHMNVSSQRIWCYYCERELYLNNKGAKPEDNIFSYSLSSFSSHIEDDTFTNGSRSGLVGLQNIANTCYMNSALQALSNLTPMTHYFINSGDLVEHIVEQSAPRCKGTGLAKSYQRLMQEIWTDAGVARDYIAPRGLLYGIRSVHSMFRGFQQHDTQEFLRCFMDQLHEELKEYNNIPSVSAKAITSENTVDIKTSGSDNEKNKKDAEADEEIALNECATSGVTTDSEYETCESSISERSTPNPVENELCNKQEVFVPPTIAGTAATNRADATVDGSAQQTQPSRYSRQPGLRAGTDPVEVPLPKECQPLATRNEPVQQQSQNQEETIQQSRSIISDVFDGKLLSSVQCLTCDRISAREETFQDLSLPIPNRDFLNVLHQNHSLSVQSLNAVDVNTVRSSESWISWMWNMFRSWFYGPSVTLYDCMASFFSADELKGDNMYSCEKCKKLRTGVKFSRVLNLPEVLCIHLKRFRHDLSYSSKITSHVFFPLEGFDMRSYLHKDCQSSVPTYNLSSVICHHGTVGGGHYTCYARNLLNGRWYEFDDQFVSEVSPETVQNCQAYVLFYQKYNPQMAMIRDEARIMSNSYPSQHSDIQFYISRDWLTRLATFAEPGPINNQDILCQHGGILHAKMPMVSQIAVPISQPVWDFLYSKFGGGPAISMLFECEICKRDSEALAQRQLFELAVFTKYNGLQTELDNGAIFAIAMPWLRKWQQFSRGLTHKEPGPIMNESIAAPLDPNLINSSASNIRSVLPGADYAQLNAPLWCFLHDIYGGGPEILVRGSLTGEFEIIDEDEFTIDDEYSLFNHDASDTESNIGRQISPELTEESTVEPTPNESNYTHVNNVSPKIVMQSPSVKYSRLSPAVSSKRLKVNGIQSANLRKRSRKQRNILKHADMFGAKGTYNIKSLEHVDNTHKSCQPDEVITTDVAFTKPESEANSSASSFQMDTNCVSNITIAATDFTTNLRLPKGKRKIKQNHIKLQKYVSLREPSGVNETDV